MQGSGKWEGDGRGCELPKSQKKINDDLYCVVIRTVRSKLSTDMEQMWNCVIQKVAQVFTGL